MISLIYIIRVRFILLAIHIPIHSTQHSKSVVIIDTSFPTCPCAKDRVQKRISRCRSKHALTHIRLCPPSPSTTSTALSSAKSAYQ